MCQREPRACIRRRKYYPLARVSSFFHFIHILRTNRISRNTGFCFVEQRMQQRIFSYALPYDCATLTTTSCFDFFLFLFFFKPRSFVDTYGRLVSNFPGVYIYFDVFLFSYFYFSILSLSLSLSLSFLFSFPFTSSFCLWECECLRSVFVTQWITTLA